MTEKATGAGQSGWWLPLCTSVVGLVVLIAIAICRANTYFFLSIFVVAPALLIVSITLTIYAAVRNRRQLLRIVTTLAMLWAIAVSLFLYNRQYPFEIRETARWLVSSSEYKQEVLVQPTSVNGDLKHIEWDASGFAGVANDTAYLVFDPADTLSVGIKSHQFAKSNGAPCDVRAIRRLESHWYAVLFYTDQVWEQCN